MTRNDHKPAHILVINDTVAILDLFQALLEDEGYRVSVEGFTVELAEMLERVEKEPPDLIVLDFIVLDELRGWQFLQLLRMSRKTKEIPVVICTAAARLVDELQVHLDTMHVKVVLKPFDLDTLLEAIASGLAG